MADDNIRGPLRLQDRLISTLEPFSEPGKPEKSASPLSDDIVKFLNFADHLNDTTLGKMAEKYVRTNHHLYIKPVTNEEVPIPPEKLEKLAEATQEELVLHRKYKTAYTIAKYTSHVSTALGVLAAGSTARFMGKKLDELDKPIKIGGTTIHLDPADYLQLFDATLKLGACTAYQLVRCAPEHEHIDLHGAEYVRHLAGNIYEDVKDAFVEPFHNQYNKQFWMGYLVFDVLLNLPAHFIMSGRPLSEMEEAAGLIGETIDHGTHDIMEQATSHIPFLRHKDKEGIQTLMGTLASKDASHQEKMTGAMKTGFDYAMNLVPSEMRDKILEATRSGTSFASANYGKRRNMFTGWVKDAQSNAGKKSAAEIIVGGLLETASAGVDIMHIYPGMSRKDITADAIHRGYIKIGGF